MENMHAIFYDMLFFFFLNFFIMFFMLLYDSHILYISCYFQIFCGVP